MLGLPPRGVSAVGAGTCHTPAAQEVGYAADKGGIEAAGAARIQVCVCVWGGGGRWGGVVGGGGVDKGDMGVYMCLGVPGLLDCV